MASHFTDEIANLLKMSQQKYSKIERGETEITDDELMAISKVLNVDPEYLKNFDEKTIFNNIFNDHAQAQQVVVYNEAVYNNFPPELIVAYSDKISKLESNKKDQEIEIKSLKEEVNRLTEELKKIKR